MSAVGKIRILLVKSGLDYHDRGVRYIARKFREAGMEVIYFQYLVVPEIIKVAIEEDVDVIGLSSSVGGYMEDIKELRNLLDQNGMGEIPLVAGGIIAKGDLPGLREMGVGAICGPGDSDDEVVEWVKNQVAA
jgi:methylmalonyl-CoA mutase C-terminal domain/subunit